MYITNLPEESKAKAIVNTLKESPGQRLDDILATELTAAFCWNNTPEGFFYWHEQDCKIKNLVIRN